MQHLSVRHSPAVALLVLSGAVVSLTSCVGGKEARSYVVVTGGAAARGVDVIKTKKCGSCHAIPGINGANGTVGPPLAYFGRRTYIGGEVPNTPQNLVQWVMSPQSIEPHTAMPALGLSEQQARDVAAYLYTLQ